MIRPWIVVLLLAFATLAWAGEAEATGGRAPSLAINSPDGTVSLPDDQVEVNFTALEVNLGPGVDRINFTLDGITTWFHDSEDNFTLTGLTTGPHNLSAQVEFSNGTVIGGTETYVEFDVLLVTTFPAQGQLIAWDEVDDGTNRPITVDFGEDIITTNMQVTLSTNVVGSDPQVGNAVHINALDRVQINLAPRTPLPCPGTQASQASIILLCPSGEEVTVRLSEVMDSSSNTLPPVEFNFTVGVARLKINNIQPGDLLRNTFSVNYTVENHTVASAGNSHMHFYYDEEIYDKGTLWFTRDNFTYSIPTNLNRRTTPLIIDLRTSTHIWIGNPESRIQMTVTLDAIDPLIEQQVPAPTATEVPLDTMVSVKFNEEINWQNADLEVLVDGSTPVAGTVSHEYDGTDPLTWKSVLVFNPDEPLLESTSYTVAVANVTDVGGLGTSDTSWSFSTLTIIRDETAPRLVEEQLAPARDAKDVPLNQIIVVEFDEMVVESAAEMTVRL